MKPKIIDRETASRINPFIGYTNSRETLEYVQRIIDDVAVYVTTESIMESCTGMGEGVSLILRAASSALRYETDNPSVARVPNVTPITA